MRDTPQCSRNWYDTSCPTHQHTNTNTQTHKHTTAWHSSYILAYIAIDMACATQHTTHKHTDTHTYTTPNTPTHKHTTAWHTSYMHAYIAIDMRHTAHNTQTHKHMYLTPQKGGSVCKWTHGHRQLNRHTDTQTHRHTDTQTPQYGGSGCEWTQQSDRLPCIVREHIL